MEIRERRRSPHSGARLLQRLGVQYVGVAGEIIRGGYEMAYGVRRGSMRHDPDRHGVKLSHEARGLRSAR